MPQDCLSQHLCAFGLGWGDEGKGKVVDLLSSHFDIVVRFNGGANAGHSVHIGDQSFALHLIPTGLLREGVIGVIGPGVVVDPGTLQEEIESLRAKDVDVSGRLQISDRAHVVMSYHKIEDRLSEMAAGTGERIGTTSRGIGPCYADKMRRTSAIRFSDLLHDPNLTERALLIAEQRRKTFVAVYGDDGGLDPSRVAEELDVARKNLSAAICDTTALLHRSMADGKRVLFEGANGVLLDVNHGTYPFVTSSSTGPHGLAVGAGVSPASVLRSLGTIKAYSTRVGAGPFVSELDNEIGDRIRNKGNEFGTTTGRPRRCGWFDAVATRYAVGLTGCTDISLMHLDTLAGFEEVGVCTAYELDGQIIDSFPASSRCMDRTKPIIEMLPGWSEDVAEARRFGDLPANAASFVARIESLVGAPVSLASVGPDRSQTLIHDRLGCLL